MVTKAKLRSLLTLHVGVLAPPIVKYLKRHLDDFAEREDAPGRLVLVNFIAYKKEKFKLKPSQQGIVATLFNTLNHACEFILDRHGEVYEKNVEHRFVNQVERAWILNVKETVDDEMHEELVELEKMRHGCIDDGIILRPPELARFQHRIKHYLRAFDPDALPPLDGGEKE